MKKIQNYKNGNMFELHIYFYYINMPMLLDAANIIQNDIRFIECETYPFAIRIICLW